MNKTFITILILVIVILGGYFLLKRTEVQAPTQETSQTPVITEESPSVDQNVATNIITFTSSGYSPNPLNIRSGDIVTFKNESSVNMWTASGMHPTHIVYSGTSLSEHCPDKTNVTFDACQGIPPGASWSFKFEKIGSWGYHDHLHPTFFGKIIVE
ncbi:hypothetical protein A3C60_01860 [Candidatus Nomurabacteria bacterium RIFCSPHIGHO2_02_FULL_37_45]|uniref:EfeO-type cupredoxin-like domain-containing protein n=1 Tax=Candidatus Nomurabacteria bacterium RIFCSPHIGHO2_12_FULL_37_29 TaxID=1801759 RepID=A0A1F6WB51_9BACT|nr:MAG: hypothetical protein A2727_02220 [Candidatus Nomurabacteria bacterium RIFCSPHIGHO2_01_FULL_37_110]OGI71161.1 MAG: hypothetical protein A3C60_01860 [Candidatus Nomurabacteria bacterium RIFCSPHIGHO2_02_FULL_37_45]OGI79137.1 MAG: hypothetical protein A3F19_00255 [Candidatus Nomurabacteria bacterium RIFCSPHIGHO2_12_FULL_37_29]OGI85487.1 MAG: hypothetical protein A3A92_02485 [Candidatus Nomurabacteria bacterium RIFCSPLOWO2_01_FULL_37_49]